MRLGELLLQHRVLTAEQLRSGLESQQAHGGRIGTHLFQLGYIDVDLLSRALGQQRGFPAALRKHVAAIDPRIIAVVPAKTALEFHIIPVGVTEGSPPRVVVAAVDPDTVPVEELAFESGSRVDVWIAPEIVVAECLEKYYGGPPVPAYAEVDVSPRRSLRSSTPAMQRKRASTAPDLGVRGSSGRVPPAQARTPAPPPPEDDDDDPDSQPIPSIRSRPPRPPTQPPARAPTPPPTPLFAPASPPPPPRQVTLAKPSLVPPEPDIPDLPPDDGWDVPSQPRPKTHPSSSRPATAPPLALLAVIDQTEASHLIAAARSKDEIGEALVAWLRSSFGCGLVLVVKNETAVGWKGFLPDPEGAIEAVAVPLGKPSLLTTPYERKVPFCGAPPRDGEAADQALWKSLRCPPPAEVLVCPVVVGKRAVNLLYAHSVSNAYLVTDSILRDAQIVAADAAAGYVRLIRERSNG
jgi:hypothetical protein